VFTPFVTTKASGSGLGLSIVKLIIERHHGSVRLECPASGGTLVVIQLPLTHA
jgi:signal transduction histidine kinase